MPRLKDCNSFVENIFANLKANLVHMSLDATDMSSIMNLKSNDLFTKKILTPRYIPKAKKKTILAPMLNYDISISPS